MKLPPQDLINCNGGFVAIPTKHFQRHRRPDLEFIVKAAREFKDQEAGLSVWHALGNSFFEILPSIRASNFYDDNVSEIEHFKDLYAGGDPFVLHYFASNITKNWYQGIGIFD